MIRFANEHHLKLIDEFEFLQGNFEKFQGEYDIR